MAASASVRPSFASERADVEFTPALERAPRRRVDGANSAHFDFFRRRQQKQNRLDSSPFARWRGSGVASGPRQQARAGAFSPTFPRTRHAGSSAVDADKMERGESHSDA